MPLVSFQKVSKYFGAECILHEIDWTIEPGQHVGLIGANGTGKTTMLNRARALAERQGYRMAGLAPSASAAAPAGGASGASSTRRQRRLR